MEIAFLVGLFLGLAAGVLSRGIQVNINHREAQKHDKIEYNDSVADQSNPEMVNWLDRNNGMGVK